MILHKNNFQYTFPVNQNFIGSASSVKVNYVSNAEEQFVLNLQLKTFITFLYGFQIDFCIKQYMRDV